MRLFFQTIRKNIKSEDRRKRLLSIGAIVLLGADLIFFASFSLVPDCMPWWLYAGVTAIPLITFFLLHINQVSAACYYFVITLNIVIYLVMSSEPVRTAFHLHMITAAFVALNLFGYKHRVAGIAFTLFSFGLALLGNSHQFSILEFRDYSPSETTLYFVINAVLFVIISTYLLLTMLKWNFSTEAIILENKTQAARQFEQMSKTNAELDHFVFKISHDLRAPFNTLSGLANLAETDSYQRADYFRLMKNQIFVMERFIREVADYSRNARLEVDSKPIVLKKLLEEVIESINHLDDFNKVAILLEVEDRTMIESDELRLKIVLGNLITNGIKYHDPEKKNPFVKISFSTSENAVLTIADNGIGIEKAHQHRIFEMFYKASERSRGIGLGLYMVQETLRKLNAKIDVESAPLIGTTFKVILPTIAK